jgi:hypothetical protein
LGMRALWRHGMCGLGLSGVCLFSGQRILLNAEKSAEKHAKST